MESRRDGIPFEALKADDDEPGSLRLAALPFTIKMMVNPVTHRLHKQPHRLVFHRNKALEA